MIRAGLALPSLTCSIRVYNAIGGITDGKDTITVVLRLSMLTVERVTPPFFGFGRHIGVVDKIDNFNAVIGQGFLLTAT